MKRILVLPFVLSLAAAYVACDSSSALSPIGPPIRHDGGGGDDASVDNGDANVVPVALADACNAFAKSRCQRNDSCTGGARNALLYGDEPTCETRTSALCVAQLGAPGTAQTPDAMQACATAIAQQPCSDFLNAVPIGACVPPAGSLTTGAACIANAQCATSFCAMAPTSACGACAAAPKSGDSCASDEQCGDRGGLVCAGGVCIAPGGRGAGCSGAIPCAAGLTCVGASAQHAGTCQAGGEDAGVACDPTGASGPSCDTTQGLVCDPRAKRCVVAAFAKGGAPCGEIDGGVALCAGGSCVYAAPDGGAIADAGPDADADVDAAADAGADAADAEPDADAGAVADAAADAGDAAEPSPTPVGACVAFATEGNPCDVAKGPGCLWPARCVTVDGGTSGACAVPSTTTCK
jgi:hypothetical protein